MIEQEQVKRGVELSVANLKECVLSKVTLGEITGSELVAHVLTQNLYIENEVMFGIMELVLEKKISYRIFNGNVLYTLGSMSNEDLQRTAQEMKDLLKSKGQAT